MSRSRRRGGRRRKPCGAFRTGISGRGGGRNAGENRVADEDPALVRWFGVSAAEERGSFVEVWGLAWVEGEGSAASPRWTGCAKEAECCVRRVRYRWAEVGLRG